MGDDWFYYFIICVGIVSLSLAYLSTNTVRDNINRGEAYNADCFGFCEGKGYENGFYDNKAFPACSCYNVTHPTSYARAYGEVFRIFWSKDK